MAGGRRYIYNKHIGSKKSGASRVVKMKKLIKFVQWQHFSSYSYNLGKVSALHKTRVTVFHFILKLHLRQGELFSGQTTMETD